MIKSDALMRLEEAGVVYQVKHGTTHRGEWFVGYREDVDITPYLLEAGMFEH